MMYLELGLACIVVFQQIFFMREINRLIDKLMSRSYTEYVKAQANSPAVPRQTVDNSATEDLGALSEFNRGF